MLRPTPSYGLRAWIARPELMGSPHFHDDIELNLLLEGRLEYAMGGHRIGLAAGGILVFWAALPHELVLAEDAEYLCATIPLGEFLQWNPPRDFANRLLAGEPFFGAPGLAPEAVGRRWASDLQNENRTAAVLEIQACLLRIARVATPDQKGGPEPTAVDQMRRTISDRYTEELTIEEIAKAASLHPNHAMRVFRDATGTTVGESIRRYRLAHAKRLLAVTELPISNVGLEAGFGSERRFFEVFRASVGMTPAKFRRSMKNP